MSSFTIEAVPEAVASHVREHGKDPAYAHPAHADTASGYGPCRSCLEPFEEGVDRRLLFTLDAFLGTGDPPNPGPVYIHAAGCGRYAGERFPETLAFIPLALEGYARGGWLRTQGRVAGTEADAAIAAMLEHDGVDYVQIRNAEAGCYIARAVRAGAGC